MANETINWLLEEENPSVRYFVLKNLLNKKNDQELQSAKLAISTSKIITKIFSKQNPDGSWEDPESPYLPKYKSSYWTIMVLGFLGIDKSKSRVAKACEHIFQFQHKEGGFISQTKKNLLREYTWRLNRGKKLPSFKEWSERVMFEQQLSCLTGNMLVALIRLGYLNDPRVKKAIKWLVKIQNQDGGWLCPYWRAHIQDKHGCFYGTICPLEAFSEMPEENLTKEMKQTIKKGAEFLLMHHLFKADHHNLKIINKIWLQLGFPWFYGYNILRGLDILTKLGYAKGKRLNDAVKILLQKRRADGTWVLENTPTGRMRANIETKGNPSKWITMIALRVLKRLGKPSN